MATQKHFLQDRTALLLVSGTAFLTLAAVVLILLELVSRQGSSYIVANRPSLGIDHYTTGTVVDILAFAVAAIIIFVVGALLGYRTYPVRRELSLVILVLTVPLLVFLIVVSNALLVLR
ncbi:MAG TPA: hypothetical protein VGM08_01170 [Candidatus Saccharimonadales bacterium]|jgi:hypothetical protein